MMKITHESRFVCKKFHAQHTTHSNGQPIAPRRAGLHPHHRGPAATHQPDSIHLALLPCLRDNARQISEKSMNS